MRSTCRQCRGTRAINLHPCTECNGKGSVVQRKKVTVPVPAGVEDGQTVRMPVGKKEIFITFRVEKSDYFKREGSDVHSETTISVAQAVLGGSTRIQGIYENMTIDVPPGTSSHTRIRLKGKGIRKVNGFGHGDHYVHVKVRVPTQLTPEQEALLRAYAEMEQDTPGTVKGVTNTKSGEKRNIEESELLRTIRALLNEEVESNPEIPSSISNNKKDDSKIREKEDLERLERNDEIQHGSNKNKIKGKGRTTNDKSPNEKIKASAA